MKALNNREVDRLFRAWGFVPVKSSGRHAGGHKFYGWQGIDGPRCAITAPGREKDTPPAALQKAAQIVGVSVREFVNGPSKVKEAVEMREMSEVSEVEEMSVVEEQIVPEVSEEVVDSATEEVVESSERRMLLCAEVVERANRPLTRHEVVDLTGLNATTCLRGLRGAVEHGLLFSRLATPAEARTRGVTGRRPVLYSHLNPVPRRRARIEAFSRRDAMRGDSVETEVNEVSEVASEQVMLRSVTFTLLKTKDDGSLVLINNEGTLFVARQVEV